MCQVCPWCTFPTRAGRRVVHRGRALCAWPYFHVGSTLLFPLPVFSLCQPGGGQDSLRSEEHPARDLFGARLHLGCSGNTLSLPLEGNECHPAEGVVAPVVPGLSSARPAVPLTLLDLCTAHGCEFGMVCSASGHTGGLEDAVTVTTEGQPSLPPSLHLPDGALPPEKGWNWN